MTRGPLASLRPTTGSLGRQILLVATAQAAVLLLASFLTLQTTAVIRSDVEAATTAYLEEQAMASRISAAVNRQLVAAAVAPQEIDPVLAAEFRSAGDEAHESIRHYLFRELEPAHRLKLEAVRERHQRMEVAAARTLELVNRGQLEWALGARDAMLEHGRELQDDMEAFLDLRAERMERSRERQAAVFRYLHMGVAAAAALLLLVVAFLARFLYRRLGMPLADLATAATRIGAGDLDTRVTRPPGAELGALADAFNAMAGRLAGARSNLRDRNQELERTLEQLRSTQLELIQTEKLSAVGQMMAGLAHELNNPLASVLGYGELALDRVDTPDPVDGEELARECLVPLVAEAARARRLVHDLLRFARRPEDDATATPLASPLHMAVRLRSYAFEQAGLELTLSAPPDLHVRGETRRLEQSFLAIINNAYDAMRSDGRGALRISASAGEGHVLVAFDDDGPGFDQPERAFEPFYTTKPVGEGTGLGLALVKRLLEGVGGRAVAENRPGGGARVVLRLPIAEVEEHARDEDAPGEDAPGDASGVVTATSRGVTSTSAVVTPRVLLVEDERPLRDLQTRLLARVGARVTAVEHGVAARELLQEDDGVDLVVSDVKMPGGGGLELYHWILEHRPVLADRFLFVTGDIAEPEIGELAERRPDRFIRKPFQMAEYLARVAEILGTPSSSQRP